ncbi:ubiquinone biosynthesis regulatory protein kinase UbiB [Psychromonas sp. Urea-02u-13]|uniref:ubiquinone biosynthesis regulatory protein kinase UbiB n=1 Tax=Psychromonas sp. Urea-02u-13 TaxID=2058326 RepID=UPI000C33EB45|nr:ubiquinone biosynthesis regulatory protein kinase UbiB [Psychromonas sp. Urea-02u-13]
MIKLKELSRLYDINKTIIEYGLIELLPREHRPVTYTFMRIVLFWIRTKHKKLSLPERLRLSLQSLGPIYIKLGQMLSTRRDLLPAIYADQLAYLQDNVPPFCGELAVKQIERSLGKTIDELFENFDSTALASASIAQVHTATLREDNREVVIKVIRPDIEKTINADIQLMKWLAQLTQRFLKDAERLRPVEVVHEYEKTIIDELDLMREGANAIQLRRNFLDSKLLYVPEIYSDYCTKNVLVMERIYGIPVSDIAALEAQGTDFKLLAERGVEAFFTQVFRDSFFHADMHPGNVFVSYEHPEDPLWIGIDCGIVGTLNNEDKRYLAENFLAFFNRDYRQVAQLHIDSGWVPEDTPVEEFEFAIRAVCEPIFEKPLSEISFATVLINLFNTARRYNMKVQPQLVLLQKTLLYIEGLGRQLYPQLDLWDTAKPFLENWMKDQVSPKTLMKKLQQKAPFWLEKLPDLPELVYHNLANGKSMQSQQKQLITSINQQQKNNSKGSLYIGLAATLTLVAALAYLQADQQLAIISGSPAIIMWLLAWRHTNKQ